jgi:uncharacterized YceG family protein
MSGRYEDPNHPGTGRQAPRGRHAGPPSDAFDALPDDDYRYPPPQSQPQWVPDGPGMQPPAFGGAAPRPAPSGPLPPWTGTGPQQQQRFLGGAPPREQTGSQPQFPSGPMPQYPQGHPSGPQPQYPQGHPSGPQPQYPQGHPSGPMPQYPGGQQFPSGPQPQFPPRFPSGPQPQVRTGPQPQFPGGQPSAQFAGGLPNSPQGFPAAPGMPGGSGGPAGPMRSGPMRSGPPPGGLPPAEEGEDWEEGGFFSGYDDEVEGEEPPRKRRRRQLAPLIALLVIVLPLGALGFFGYQFYMSKYHPADYTGEGTGSVTVHVPPGATASSLGPELQQQGVVASARAFVLAAEHYTGTGGLEPGFFKLHLHMQASIAYEILANPKNIVQTNVTLPEGLRSVNVLAVLAQKTTNSLASYQAAFKDVAKLGLPSYANGNPEGYLFPDTYSIQPNQSALQVLQEMVAKFNQEAASVHLTTAASTVGMTPGQLIIVASLIQAEGGTLSDYPKVSEVVYNRLRLKMKLQFDSTVLYGLKTYGTRATDAQLKINTPYNTYMHPGLPPTPIDNPGLAAINAALHPASGNNYLYFCSLSQNHTEFSANPLSCP